MSIAVQCPEPSQKPSNPDQRVAVGDMTHRSSGARRVLAALGVVLAMLLGSAVAITAPAGADAPSFSVVATVGVGSPSGVAMSPDGSRVYVSNVWGNSVSVIDTSTNEVVATVGVGSAPSGVAVSPDGSRVYVTNGDDTSVSVIDTSTNEVVATVDVGSAPSGVAVSPDGSRLYLLSIYVGVIVFDTSTNEVVATVGLDDYLHYIAVSPDGSRVYVGNYFDYSVSVIDTSTNEVVATVGVGSSPAGVAVSPDGSRVYVGVVANGSVRVIDTSTNEVVEEVGGGSPPTSVAVSPDGSLLYVAVGSDDSVIVFDTSTNEVVATVGVGSYPYGFAVSPDGSRLYVNNYFGDSVSVLSAPPSVTAPAAPTSLNVTPGDGSGSVSFTAGADGGASISNYEYQLDGGSWTALSPADTTSPVTISGLTNGTAYTVKLRAVNVAGSGASSVASASFTPRTVPGAPSITSVTPGDSTVSVAFTAGSTGGSLITDYEYQLNGSGSWFSLGTTSSPASIGVTNGVAYTVKLRAVNVAGNGAASSASGSFTPAAVPSAPTSLVATAGVGSASIAFTAGADGGASITKYQVKVGSGSWTDAVGTTSPITITGLTNNVVAAIRLRAVNAAGDGVASAAVQVWPRIAGSALSSLKAQSRTKIRASVAALNPVGGTVSHYWFTAYAKGTATVVSTCRATAAVRSCVFSGLLAGTEYDVSARGFFTLTGSAAVLQTLDSDRRTVRTKS